MWPVWLHIIVGLFLSKMTVYISILWPDGLYVATVNYGLCRYIIIIPLKMETRGGMGLPWKPLTSLVGRQNKLRMLTETGHPPFFLWWLHNSMAWCLIFLNLRQKSSGVHSSGKKARSSARGALGKGFGWQKKKNVDKLKKFKKWTSVSDKRQFVR